MAFCCSARSLLCTRRAKSVCVWLVFSMHAGHLAECTLSSSKGAGKGLSSINQAQGRRDHGPRGRAERRFFIVSISQNRKGGLYICPLFVALQSVLEKGTEILISRKRAIKIPSFGIDFQESREILIQTAAVLTGCQESRLGAPQCS